MRAAFHTYLTYAWIADRYQQAQPDAPARAARRARPASCVIRSGRSSARATCRWRTSASSSGMFLPTSRRRHTGTRSGPR